MLESRKTNWAKLSKKKYDEVWDRFYSDFDFKPSINSWPSVESKLPTLKLDIREIFRENYPNPYLVRFCELGQELLIDISKPNKRLYALDWQHECYEFDPKLGMSESELFTPSLVPDGDYYIFLSKDFSNVWFGHPWEQAITLIGEDVVNNGLRLTEEFRTLQIPVHRLE